MLHLLAPEDRARVLQELHRVVRPGGRVAAVTVDARGRRLQLMLSVVPSRTGLRRIDLGAELKGVGLRLVRVRYARSGWSSVCLLAERKPPL